MIKTECWDEMVVKGRSVKSFNGLNQVSNYPMHDRTEEELAELQYVIQLRTIEDIDTDIRKKTFSPEIAAYNSLVGKAIL